MGRKKKEKPPRNACNKINRHSSSPSSNTITESKYSGQNPHLIPRDPFDDAILHYTESQLEDLLRKNLHSIYRQALAYLISEGYDESVARQAILSYGKCLGMDDALSNIVRNSLSALRSKLICSGAASNMTQRVDLSISAMVQWVRFLNLNLTRDDALWCLLLSEIHPFFASMIADSSWIVPLTPWEPKTNVVESVLKGMSLEDGSKIEEDVWKKIVRVLDLKYQVKERKKWAQEKVLQAVKKLSRDMTELKILRTESEEWLLKWREHYELNAKLRNENTRAEIEVTKMMLSMSAKELMKVERKERKLLKAKLKRDKQKEKFIEEIDEEEKKIQAVEKELNEVKKAQEDVDVKWREEKEAAGEAMALAEEAKRAKEETETRTNTKFAALCIKTEMDDMIYKDDINRLVDELSLLLHQSKISEEQKPHRQDIDCSSRAENIEKNKRRKCVICMDDEVGIVFLPCRHQVICAGCNEVVARCPSCNVAASTNYLVPTGQ